MCAGLWRIESSARFDPEVVMGDYRYKESINSSISERKRAEPLGTRIMELPLGDPFRRHIDLPSKGVA